MHRDGIESEKALGSLGDREVKASEEWMMGKVRLRMILGKMSERLQDKEVRGMLNEVQSESKGVLGTLKCLMDREVSQELMVR